MKRKILILLVFIACFFTTIGQQYNLYRIYDYGANYQDTIYIKANTDSLYRKDTEGNYTFLYKPKSKSFTQPWYVIGGVGSSTPDWSSIQNKPTTFTPSTHGHSIADVTSLQAAIDGKQASLVSGTNIKTINGTSLLGSGDISITAGSVEWTDILNKPATFTPSAHSHAISDVTGLQAAIDGKQSTITQGTTLQYFRGDLSLATFPVTTASFANSTNKNFVTDAHLTLLGNTSGSNTGDQDLSTLMVKANNLSDLTNASTARTNLGVNTTVNISNSTNKNFVTDAHLTLFGNTSGTNTGDNATNSQYSGLVSNATHTGDATGSTALTVVRINGVSLAGLGTGILKNTTGTGAPSIAVAGDFPTLNQSTTGGAATLTTPRNIQGVAFNGSANIDLINGTGFVKATGTTLSYDNSTYQPLATNLTSIGALANGNGFLKNNGSGTFTYETPAGAGTVTNTGNLTSNAVVLGNGTTDTKVVAGITTNGIAQLVLGVNTSTLGSVKMFGNTSGDATIQPAAVAGTNTVITLPSVTSTLLPNTTTSGVAASPTASGTVTVTHNLGRAPTTIEIFSISSFTSSTSATPVPFSMGTWNSTGNRCLYMVINGTTTQVSQTSTVFSIIMVTSAGNSISGVIGNVTSTSFDIVFTEVGTHTAGNYLWKAQ